MNIVPHPTGPEDPPPDQPFLREVVAKLDELEDALSAAVTTTQQVIGGLVLLDDQAAAVNTISEQARVVERFRLYVEGLLDRLDPSGTSA